MRARKLKVWNGVSYGLFLGPRGGEAHLYVGAYSVEDIQLLFTELGIRSPSKGEIREYWSSGAWGRSMDGIAVERGVWAMTGTHEKPVRVQPKGCDDQGIDGVYINGTMKAKCQSR